MTKKKIRNYSPIHLIKEIEKWPNPIYDQKHNLYIHINGRARSNQSRIEHITEYSHDLKVRDLKSVCTLLNGGYFAFKKDPKYKGTYNYYFMRKGKDKGLIKVSIQVDHKDPTLAWIKTIFITYKIK